MVNAHTIQEMFSFHHSLELWKQLEPSQKDMVDGSMVMPFPDNNCYT
jgi:hypothetical protein